MEWISVEEHIPNVFAGKFEIRIVTGKEFNAFFYSDKMAWIAFYRQTPCFWWDAEYPHKPIYNVTHWRENGVTY